MSSPSTTVIPNLIWDLFARRGIDDEILSRAQNDGVGVGSWRAAELWVMKFQSELA